MEKPLIGLTTSRMPNPSGLPAFSTNLPYPNAVTNAGGLPVLLPIKSLQRGFGGALTQAGWHSLHRGL